MQKFKEYTLEEFEKVRGRVMQNVRQTPLIYSKWLSSLYNARIYLKLEALNLGHSFKIRGATNAILHFIEQNGEPKRVITASGGNHGLGVAIASYLMNIPCLVVLPEGSSGHRIQVIESYNAKILLHGESWQEANEHALSLVVPGADLYIHPFADRDVYMGQGTVGLEILDQITDFDVLIASVGGGGLLSGISLALDAHDMIGSRSIISVETEGSDCYKKSRDAGHLVQLSSIDSIAVTLGAKTTTDEIFNILNTLTSHSLTVSDKESVFWMKEFLNSEKILIEPASSCVVAALEKIPDDQLENKTVILVICGSNISLDEFIKWDKQFLI